MVSAFDYWDHISRPGDPFAEASLAWLGFTAASTISVFVIAWATSFLLQRFAQAPDLVASTMGIMLAIWAHLMMLGPLWDALFWTGGLRFDGILVPIVVGVVAYWAYRLMFWLAVEALARLRRDSRG